MTSGQAKAISTPDNHSLQNWFQPTKRLPNKIFGSLIESLGTRVAGLNRLELMGVRPGTGGPGHLTPEVVPWSPARSDDLFDLACVARGSVYAKAEELDQDDILLEQADEMYRAVGLRRYRRVFLAYRPGDTSACAAIVAYRGPLGLNFSFLENRCDLLTRPGLHEAERHRATQALIAAAWPTYEGFEPGQMFVTCDAQTRLALEHMGGEFIRQYAQSQWLREGYEDYYQHLDKFYRRVMRSTHRRGLGHAA